MIKQVQVKASTQGIDLYLLGVDEKWHNSNPSASSFPSRFNPQALSVWTTMLKSEEYFQLVKGKDNKQRWSIAIQTFIKQSSTEGFDPFGSELTRVDNNAIISYLTNARNKVASFIDSVDLFDVVTGKDPWTDITPRAVGFKLRCNIALSWSGTAEDLRKYLTHRSVGFTPFSTSEGSVLYKFVDSTVRLYCKIISRNRATLYYEIAVSSEVYFPAHQKKTKKAYLEYLESTLWRPAIKARRMKNLGFKLF